MIGFFEYKTTQPRETSTRHVVSEGPTSHSFMGQERRPLAVALNINWRRPIDRLAVSLSTRSSPLWTTGWGW
jgi:hypothetical protein